MSGVTDRIGPMVELREAQSSAQHLPTGVERRARNACVKRRAHEIGNLPRLLQNRAKDCRDIRGAVGTQSNHGGRRESHVDRVDDHATRGKGNLALGSDAGGNVGFGVDRCSAGLGIKRPFVGRLGDRSIHSEDIRVLGGRKPFEKRTGPGPIGGKNLLAGSNRGGDDPVACPQAVCQSTGDPKADDAGNAPGDGRGEIGRELPARAADDGHAGPQGDPRL